MLTFETLVTETIQKLKTTNPDITPELVRDVLTDAGIDESLRDSMPSPQGRLVVHSVRIVGQKLHAETPTGQFHYYRKLGSGLWAWVGSNGSGKSTILNCILWALTGSDTGIPKRVRPWINEVVVEFSVGESQFTTRVNRTNDGVTGGIYQGFVPLDVLDLGAVQPVTLFNTRDEMREAVE